MASVQRHPVDRAFLEGSYRLGDHLNFTLHRGAMVRYVVTRLLARYGCQRRKWQARRGDVRVLGPSCRSVVGAMTFREGRWQGREGGEGEETVAEGEGEEAHVLIEFSSPNIAKPFHAGHLRSTLLGQWLVHLHQHYGYHVKAINYLGDWGKQFGASWVPSVLLVCARAYMVTLGLLAVAWETYGSRALLEKEATKHLYDIYVRINKDAAEEDAAAANDAAASSSIHQRARDYFRRMEEGRQTSRDYCYHTSFSFVHPLIRFTQCRRSTGTRFVERVSVH